jgi:PAS domain S-box-containing protein
MPEPAEQALRDALAFAESIIDTVRDPLLVLDDGLRVVRASPEFYRTFGVAREETQGRLVYELGNGQWDIPRLRALLEEILPQQTTFRDFEVEHTFEHIGRRVMLLNARRLRRGPGEREMILLAIEDATARRDAEEARREAETRFTEMVKNVRDHSIFLTDPQGVVTSWNVAAERIIGYPEAEAVGRHFSLIFTPEDVKAGLPERELRQAREWGRAEDERWHRRKSGERFWALGIVTPLRDAAGKLTGYSKILRDMTERRRAEEELRLTEERFRLMVQAVQDYAVFLMDPAGNVTSWNEGAQRILGYTAEEIVGKPGALFFTEEDRRGGLAGRELRTAAETGRATDENWLVSKGGVRFWASGATTALRDESGRLRGFVKILRDLTERRQAEERVRESEERLRVALAAAQMGTWRWRIPQDEQLLDDSLRRLMGLPPGQEALSLEGFLSAVHAADRDRVRAEFERCRDEGCVLNVEFRVTWPDGSVHWLKDQGQTLTGPDGPFMTGAAMDITDRKHMEEELREADRRKDEFLAMLGHELRNPLAPLRSVMETLRRHQLDGPALERAYAMMDRQVVHLSRLVDDLLDVSRINRGLVELRKEPVNLAEVAHQAAEMAAPAIEGRGHELSLTLPRKPLRVGGDATRLTQVVFNLLNNAAKYTDPGGRIWLTVERDADQALVRVRDNGTGMKPDLVPRVFDLFTQGERTLDRSQGGLGLGLTLVKRLVEMHGGTVEAHSEGPGRGSEFTVRLPALPAEAEPPPARPSVPPPAAQVGRALVVDDVPDIAESFSWMLEGLAREVKVAHSGPAALEQARDFRPDLVLCDLGMPGMDGYETCRRLRQLPGLGKAVIAAVSGYGGEDFQRKSLEAGFDRHLVKPIGRAVLEELVKSAAASE